MKINNFKKFKLFEEKSEDYFPSFEEVKDYFYDFTDELNITIYYFQSGYKYFLKPHTVEDLSNNYDKILKDKSNYIDVLNTSLSNKRLLICSNYTSIDSKYRQKEVGSDSSIQAIKDGAKVYNHIMFEFNDSYFRREYLPKLVECLKRFYHETNFRPYGEVMLENRYIKDEGIVPICRFSGLFLDCSDEEYKKISEIYSKEGENILLISDYFI